MIANASAKRATRWSYGRPKASNSRRFQPAPRPSTKRPPLTSSIVAAILASSPGGWKPAHATSGPSVDALGGRGERGEQRPRLPRPALGGGPARRRRAGGRRARSSRTRTPRRPAPSRGTRASARRARPPGAGCRAASQRRLYADHERDRGDDDRGADDHRDRDRLAVDQPAEQDRHDRVHVRVGRDLRDRHVLQQPRVGRVGEQRAERDQVDEPEDRAQRPGGRVEVAELAADQRRPRTRRGRRAGSASRSRRAGRAAARCAARRTSRSPTSAPRRCRPAGRRCSRRPDGLTTSASAGEAEQQCADAASGDVLAGEEAQEHHPERDRADQQRGETGRDGLLGDADRPRWRRAASGRRSRLTAGSRAWA